VKGFEGRVILDANDVEKQGQRIDKFFQRARRPSCGLTIVNRRLNKREVYE